MPHTASNWGELIEPLLNRQFFYVGFSQADRRQSMLPTLFNMQGSQFAEEKALAIGGFSTQGWNFEDSGRVQYDEIAKGYEVTFAHKQFAKGFIVERKLIDDNRLPEVFNQASSLGDSAFRMREKAGAQIFTNAFSAATSQTLDDWGTDAIGADSVALCSTAHKRSPSDSTTQTNEGVLALTKDNLSTTRQLHMALEDMHGDVMNVMPDEILVPPELEDAALTIVRSQMDPTSANNAINPQAGRFRVIAWHYLTDANAWFTIDSALRRQNLPWYDRIPLEFGREGDFDTFQQKFRSYMRFTLGWRDWRWVYGQNPS